MQRKSKSKNKREKRKAYSAEEHNQIAIVFSHIEYVNIPFGHLHQLEKAGILNIYLLLSDAELKEAEQRKFRVFDYMVPQTILEHYKSFSDHLKIHVMNTEEATTEEEKLFFYLDNVQQQYDLNIFLCKEEMQWTSDNSRAKPPHIEITRYRFIPFVEKKYRDTPALSEGHSFSDEAVKLLHRDANPCFCHQLGLFDVSNYQWLFNIFVELIKVKISSAQGELHEDLRKKLKNLIKEYNVNIISVEKAEASFNKAHHKARKKSFKTSDGMGFFLTSKDKENAIKKEQLKESFPEIIKQLIYMYNEIILQERAYLSTYLRKK